MAFDQSSSKTAVFYLYFYTLILGISSEYMD